MKMMINHPFNESYPIRTAKLGTLYIISASQAAAVQIGDRGSTNAKLFALAVQRRADHKTSGDVFFESYRIFDRPLPVLSDPEYENGDMIQIERIHCSPYITVGRIKIIATGSSASIQIGNSMRYTAESRIKHIRQYPRPRPVPPVN
ncbi:spore germination protein GerPE [Paenibacillus castaneae]|uniref:spore germination protein GerPE n=1 Tax=Paenibacillus castaneae TaxID=474957 RepID=UPI001FB90FCE|nr:spore germination protein GerPE [Paenibacillus castaneae]